MTTLRFLKQLSDLSPVVSDGTVVEFGDVTAECSVDTVPTVCVVPQLIRLQVHGADRAAFLHNFCTNDIKQLPAGRACEAIFTDVRARVLGHGYVLAGESSHEIWMLPGDKDALFNHLNRYIITEDVRLTQSEESVTALLLTGPGLDSPDLPGMDDFDPLACTLAANVSRLNLNWKTDSLLVCGVDEAIGPLWSACISSGWTPAGQTAFEYLRITEGYPYVGTDVTDDHLAPEAGRNEQCISYTKGCYLGQEPIARIDAMGHVNRLLYPVSVHGPADPQETRNQLTSVCPPHCPQNVGLAMLTVKDVSGGQIVARREDQTLRVSILNDQ
ncbi:MAG: hypothetical protein NXI04_00915 [Planctomycetaceae bacterium]|nr:hypothetical protein [Planctomycetaceae bacterium]